MGREDPIETGARIGYRFRDPVLAVQVFTHRSFEHESRDPASSDNERLEFLGDAVLGLIVSRLLYERFPDWREGELSRLRSRLVSARHLARKARALGLGRELRLGRGEEKSGGREKDSILADAYESLIAGVLLDGGWDVVQAFVAREFEGEIEAHAEAGIGGDHKSQLQEALHVVGSGEPVYHVVDTSGPDHRKCFEVAVVIDGAEVARGTGPSKKSAQQEAARLAIARLELG